jgi:hypothetical protein
MVVRVFPKHNVNVGPGIVVPLFVRREVTVRVRNYRHLTGDESNQYKRGSAAAKHGDLGDLSARTTIQGTPRQAKRQCEG